MLNKRVHILFEKDLWNRLTKMAKSENISAGEYIRRAVREYKDSNKEALSKEKPITPFNRFFKSGRK